MYLINEAGVFEQFFFAIAVGSPDVRSNSPCQGGHTIFAQYFTITLQQWVVEMTGVKAKNLKRT